jgi:poly(3-hydroxybutyrate) depolymerase
MLALLALSLLTSNDAAAASQLDSYNVDLGRSSVSGLSAGAYMAVQMHVAFSATLVGAGIIAGGPFYCTQGSRFALWFYLYQCTHPSFWVPAPNAARLAQAARSFAASGKIDELHHLRNDRVYLFSGGNDYLVTRDVVNQARAFYKFVGLADRNIVYVRNPLAGHAILTKAYGNACFASATPFVNDCDYDQPGAILGHIYGKLNPPAPAADHGELREFFQTEFIAEARAHSVSDVGYVYLPRSCLQGDRCRVHVVFHGCQQAAERVGDAVYRRAGYNNWAATNNIIVLYPQLVATPRNPDGCWDWWGYDTAYYYTKKAPQMAAVMAMVRRLANAH